MSRPIVRMNAGAHLARNTSVSLLVSLLLLALTLPVWAADKEKDEETLKNAKNVLQEMLTDKNIPSDVVAKADCVIVLPNVKKVGFVVGGSGGRGPLVCRLGKTFKGKWSAPAMYSIGGISAGFQAGATSSDFLVLVMNKKGVNAILNGKIRLGANATVAAGPSGATAHTVSGSDILTYGRSRGLFAGVSLSGASLQPDDDANKRLYGKAVTPREIVRENKVEPPAVGGEALIALLDRKAGKRSY